MTYRYELFYSNGQSGVLLPGFTIFYRNNRDFEDFRQIDGFSYKGDFGSQVNPSEIGETIQQHNKYFPNPLLENFNLDLVNFSEFSDIGDSLENRIYTNSVDTTIYIDDLFSLSLFVAGIIDSVIDFKLQGSYTQCLKEFYALSKLFSSSQPIH